eukprot:Nk52_evm21s219 gene=Nk52_evmTU21s219
MWNYRIKTISLVVSILLLFVFQTHAASLKAAQTNPSKAPNLGLGCQSELVGTISGDAILAPKSGADLVEADSGNPTFYDGYAPRAKFPKSASQETSVSYDISKDNSVGCVEVVYYVWAGKGSMSMSVDSGKIQATAFGSGQTISGWERKTVYYQSTGDKAMDSLAILVQTETNDWALQLAQISMFRKDKTPPNLNLGCQTGQVAAISGGAILHPEKNANVLQLDAANPEFYDDYSIRAKFLKSNEGEGKTVTYNVPASRAGCVEIVYYVWNGNGDLSMSVNEVSAKKTLHAFGKTHSVAGWDRKTVYYNTASVENSLQSVSLTVKTPSMDWTIQLAAVTFFTAKVEPKDCPEYQHWNPKTAKCEVPVCNDEKPFIGKDGVCTAKCPKFANSRKTGSMCVDTCPIPSVQKDGFCCPEYTQMTTFGTCLPPVCTDSQHITEGAMCVDECPKGKTCSPANCHIAQISTGPGKTKKKQCALLSDGSVKCVNPQSKVSVPSGLTGASYKNIDGEDSNFCAVKSDGRLECSPPAKYTTLLANPVNVMAGIERNMGMVHGCYVERDTELAVCQKSQGATANLDGADIVPDALKNVQFTMVSAGRTNSCGVRKDNSAIECWGSSGYGFLDDKPTMTGFDYVTVGYGAACGTFKNGTALCWGNNRRGRTTQFFTFPKEADAIDIKTVAGPASTSCAISSKGTIRCTYDIGDDIPVTSLPLINVVDVAFGDYRFCALLGNGLTQCYEPKHSDGFKFVKEESYDKSKFVSSTC